MHKNKINSDLKYSALNRAFDISAQSPNEM